MSRLSFTTALILLQSARVDDAEARVDELRRVVEGEAEQLVQDLAEENRRAQSQIDLAWKHSGDPDWDFLYDWQDVQDLYEAIECNRDLMEEPERYVEHAVPLSEAEDLLDALYEAADVVQHHVGHHVGTAKGTLRSTGRRRGKVDLRDSEKWDCSGRRTGRVSWKRSRSRQYRPVAAPAYAAYAQAV